MRVREWYSWHFPELARVVADNYMYARLVTLLGKKEEISEELLPQIQEITDDPEKAAAVLAAARSSMGFEISDADISSILLFSKRVVSLTEYRKQLSEYLKSKMDVVAPNLAQLIGDTVGARLIAHAGSLTNLAKYPASTIQILGAEKALFRALKTKGNTPKYGLLFHSSFIGRAQPKNKGRISRYVVALNCVHPFFLIFCSTGILPTSAPSRLELTALAICNPQ
jgi:nucleolar protein 56